MLKFKHSILSLFIVFFVLGCGSSNTRHSADFSEISAAKEVQRKRAIIRSASISIEVSDPEATALEINSLIKEQSGYIEYTHNSNQEHISLTTKIPETNLDSFLIAIESKGKLLSKSRHSKDVTEESIDIDAKLKNLIVLRDKFRALLAKAENVIETLAIEKELTRIQSKIDSIQGHQKILQSQVSFSRVEISIVRETIYGPLGYLGKGIYWVFKKLFVIQ